ncbi:hypothetical protein DFQ14_12221 [Halopolyspora algeriensis]|uniref:Uncharacterized protein n=1 Tax=Halopolyspora algeriensis TaxID=1500506 RepID=A0A368VBG4_9ACTN|nr:hypothetical protein [Halopolyspora algeriensis]RCW38478.1 hypothetical protein DFQ14_12221 [Halopolyspora algeriensis]TQM42641.1 hypothetical protein FHU43_4280 [Halopolyspora algeriensis]
MSLVDLAILAAACGLFTRHQYERVHYLRALAQTFGHPAGTVPTGHNKEEAQP